MVASLMVLFPLDVPEPSACQHEPLRAARRSCHACRIDETRIDRWLWAVRLSKTRSEATDACRGGHVRVNGKPAKPAAPVRVGDRVEARVQGRERILEVVRIIDKRVGAPIAAECLVDHSPPVVRDEAATPLFERDRGAGRPTKRDRRDLDRLREGR
jgi:ribosome-associated heat shock protein Hsp15